MDTRYLAQKTNYLSTIINQNSTKTCMYETMNLAMSNERIGVFVLEVIHEINYYHILNLYCFFFSFNYVFPRISSQNNSFLSFFLHHIKPNQPSNPCVRLSPHAGGLSRALYVHSHMHANCNACKTCQKKKRVITWLKSKFQIKLKWNPIIFEVKILLGIFYSNFKFVRKFEENIH